MADVSALDLEMVEALLKEDKKKVPKESVEEKKENKKVGETRKKSQHSSKKKKSEKKSKSKKSRSRSRHHKKKSGHKKKKSKSKEKSHKKKSSRTPRSSSRRSRSKRKSKRSTDKNKDEIAKKFEDFEKELQEREIKAIQEKIKEAEKEAEDAKRDELTVLVLQMPLHAKEYDIYQLFSKAGCGKIRDIQIIRDPKNGRSKGVAYCEFYSQDSVFKALTLSGTLFQDSTIKVIYTCFFLYLFFFKVQPSHAEKNRAHARANQYKLTKTEQDLEQPSLSTKIYIGGLNGPLADIQEEDLQSLFNPFGPIEFIDLRRDPQNNKCVGFALIQYTKAKDARAAIDAMDNFSINKQRIKVKKIIFLIYFKNF